MGQDKVYVALFEKYIASNQADWFTEKQRTYLFDRGYYLMANQLGMQAANINLVDTLEKPVSVYGIKGDYTVICFWDPTCGHCKEVVPRLDSFFQQKWKQRGVQLLGIMSDGGKQAWVEYIREHKLNGWIHAYETEAMKKALYDANQPNFRQLYDVITTPVLYLLDKDKRIIAKKLTFDQIDNVIDQKRKQ
jgi:protein-disulfide isomerase